MHKETWRIIEIVIHLKLYDGSLNGEAIAKHILDAMDEYGLDVSKWRATMLDRASTNKGALNIIEAKKKVSPFKSFCISHGYAGCGKKHKMGIGKTVLKQLTKMVQYSLCKGKFVYHSSI